MEELLKEIEAAKFLTLSVATLQAWRTKRKGPAFIRLSNRAVRYRQSDLEAFVQQKTVRTNPVGGGNFVYTSPTACAAAPAFNGQVGFTTVDFSTATPGPWVAFGPPKP